MRRRHRRTRFVEDETLQQGRRLRAAVGASFAGAFPDDGVYPVPKPAVDDGFVFAGIGNALVDGLADISTVPEQLVEHPLVDGLAIPIADVLLSKFAGQQSG